MGSGNDERDGRSKGRICPACGAALETVVRQEIEIDRCPNCRGIWLDRGELEKLFAAGSDHGHHATYERYSGEEGGDHDPAGRLATRRSFFAELFEVD